MHSFVTRNDDEIEGSMKVWNKGKGKRRLRRV